MNCPTTPAAGESITRRGWSAPLQRRRATQAETEAARRIPKELRVATHLRSVEAGPWRCMGCGKVLRPGRSEPCWCPQFSEGHANRRGAAVPMGAGVIA